VSAVGPIVSAVGPIVSAVGPIVSAVGPIVSAVGPIVSAVRMRSYLCRYIKGVRYDPPVVRHACRVIRH
jgi:phage-related protein